MHGMLEVLIDQAKRSGISYSEFITITRKHFIQNVLLANKGNRSKAAKELHMHRNTLMRNLEELGIDVSGRSRKPIVATVEVAKAFLAGA